MVKKAQIVRQNNEKNEKEERLSEKVERYCEIVER